MLKIGTTTINKAYLGTTEIGKIYLGTTEIFNAGGELQTYDARIAENDDDGTEIGFPFGWYAWDPGDDEDD